MDEVLCQSPKGEHLTVGDLALSYERGINQSSPEVTIYNFSIEHIFQTGETATWSSFIHKATPRKQSFSKDERNHPDFQSF